MLQSALSIFLLSYLLVESSAGYSGDRRPRKHDRDEMQPQESAFFGLHHGHSKKHGTYWDGWMKGWFDGLKMCSDKHGYGDEHSNPYSSGHGYTGPVRYGHANSKPVHFYLNHGLESHKGYKTYYKGGGKGYSKGWH